MSDPGDTLKLIVAISKGILRDQRVRRSFLFAIVLADILWVFLGSVIFDPWLMASPLRFLIYWSVCAVITFFSILLAVHDMLMIRAEAKRERHRLNEEVFGMRNSSPDSNFNDPQ